MVNARLIDKIERGDRITDDELLDAREHYKTLADLLLKMGQRWEIAFCKANQEFIRLDQYRQSRGLKA